MWHHHSLSIVLRFFIVYQNRSIKFPFNCLDFFCILQFTVKLVHHTSLYCRIRNWFGSNNNKRSNAKRKKKMKNISTNDAIHTYRLKPHCRQVWISDMQRQKVFAEWMNFNKSIIYVLNVRTVQCCTVQRQINIARKLVYLYQRLDNIWTLKRCSAVGELNLHKLKMQLRCVIVFYSHASPNRSPCMSDYYLSILFWLLSLPPMLMHKIRN